MSETLKGMSSMPKDAKKAATAGEVERTAVRDLVKAARARGEDPPPGRPTGRRRAPVAVPRAGRPGHLAVAVALLQSSFSYRDVRTCLLCR